MVPQSCQGGDGQTSLSVGVPALLDDAARVAGVLGPLLELNRHDRYLRGWEASCSMAISCGSIFLFGRPCFSDPEIQFLIANDMVDCYESPLTDYTCIRLLEHQRPKAEKFMDLYLSQVRRVANGEM